VFVCRPAFKLVCFNTVAFDLGLRLGLTNGLTMVLFASLVFCKFVLSSYSALRKCTGGLKYSSVIDRNLVSAFVPFLPLEREHVKMCIHDNATAKGIKLYDKQINDIADELEYFPPETPLFSTSGCKRVDEKVNMYRKRRRSEL